MKNLLLIIFFISIINPVVSQKYYDSNVPTIGVLNDSEKNLLNKFKQNLQKSNMSSFSNLFRYELIKQQQGWWFDSDCICIETVDKFIELASDEPFILGLENTNLVGSSVMYVNDLKINQALLNEINFNNFTIFICNSHAFKRRRYLKM